MQTLKNTKPYKNKFMSLRKAAKKLLKSSHVFFILNYGK